MKATLFASYVTQVYISLIGIILMPVYLNYLGAEAFGLVGLLIMLQAWMPILDMGLTPVLMREMSRFRAGKLTALEAGSRLRTLEVILGTVALVLVVLLWVGGDWIGANWLSAAELPKEVIARSVTLIGLAATLRWLAGVYRATLTGLEYQNYLNGISAVFVTLRFAGVLPLLMYISSSPEWFFAFQVGVGFIELAAFAIIAHGLIPVNVSIRPDWRALLSMLPMVGSMSILVVIWIVGTQVDKLILSGLLPLKEYGYFSLATVAASGILVLAPPLNQVIQPRLNILVERGEEGALTELYRLVSHLAVIAFTGLGGGVAFFAEPLLRIWSGSDEVAHMAAPVLFWYGLGNAIVGILILPFMLQFARGRLRLHVLGNVIFLATFVPILIYAASYWGAIGAGRVYFASNLLFLLLWVPLVHRHFLPAMVWRWLFRDTLPLVMVMLGIFAIASWALPDARHAPECLAWIGLASLLAVIFGLLLGENSRLFAMRFFSLRKQ